MYNMFLDLNAFKKLKVTYPKKWNSYKQLFLYQDNKKKLHIIQININEILPEHIQLLLIEQCPRQFSEY